MDWSFRDGDGDRVTVSREAIEALHPDTAAEINAALDTPHRGPGGKKSEPRIDGSTWAEQTSSDLAVCLRFGWTWEELMATPASVVQAAVALLNEQAAVGDAGPGQEWPED